MNKVAKYTVELSEKEFAVVRSALTLALGLWELESEEYELTDEMTEESGFGYTSASVLKGLVRDKLVFEIYQGFWKV